MSLVRNRQCFWVLCAICLLIFSSTRSNAQIATDGTVGPAQNLAGPNYDIGAELGTTRGANLFHSFKTFNIHTGESATFRGPDGIANVISRVTGGESSNIDGLLRSEVGRADFFFINPAGVMFGPNAQVDVPAGFHVGTADELRFDDGSLFSAADPDASTLSMAQPESFGYLAPQPASLTVNGSQLKFDPNSHVSVVAGDVTIQDNASLTSEGGAIRITAVGDSEAAVALASGSAESPPSGTIAIGGSSTLDVSESQDVSETQGSETVALRGGLIEVADSAIAADHRRKEDSVGQIRLEADSVRVINSDVHALVFGAGRGNDIVVVGEDLDVDAATAFDGRSRLATRVVDEASGSAGDVRVEAARVALTNGGQLSSIVEEGGVGPGGMVEVQASDSILITGSNDWRLFSGIGTTTLSNANATGGNIVINSPTASFTIAEGGFLQSGTFGVGQAGDITIAVRDLEIAAGAAINSSTWGIGDAGEIRIESDGGSISLDDASIVDAATFGSGAAGEVVIRASDLSLSLGSGITASSFGIGTGGYVDIDITGSALIEDRAFIGRVGSSGPPSQTKIKATTMEIRDGGSIADNTLGDAYAGTIVVEAIDLLIDGKGNGFTGIFADTLLGSGNGGEIQVTATGRLDISNRAQISSSSTALGAAGRVMVDADDLVISGDGSGIFSTAINALGPAGEVRVEANEWLTILSGGQISASTIGGSGAGGTVAVEARKLVIDGEGQRLTTGILARTTESSGSGGGVDVIAGERLEIRHGGQISTGSALVAGGAGTVTVRAADLLVDGKGTDLGARTGIFSGVVGTASGGISFGAAGDVNVTAGRLALRNGGEIGASSGIGGGEAGSIMVTMDELSMETSSQIATSSIGTTGGEIVINGNVLSVRDSLVTTSVQNAGSDGGDIILAPDFLVLDGGFVQANAGQGARGGDILVDSRALVASRGELQVGGKKLPFQRSSGRNVIQAAAPGGEQGTITITAPELDISGDLTNLSTGFVQPARLSDACAAVTGESGGSLVLIGRGGMPAGPKEPAAVSFGGERLRRWMPPSTESSRTGAKGPNGGLHGVAAVLANSMTHSCLKGM